ncbi:aminophospholipid translocase [Coemansia interrupta]|uniref:Phospholipid-transporting ATPase n=1 Tax=Coemansia interrupta TaxID=1126814 RepID=A0A9W8HNC0_9FUNG|nr:aminophospholipid translocase [Coemansia interrupta]
MPYGPDDDSAENLVQYSSVDNSSHSYLHSPLVEDDSISVHPPQSRRPAHQLSVRRAVEREEHARREAARTSTIPYDDTLQEVEYEDHFDDQYEYDGGGFTSMSKPYGKHTYETDDMHGENIMERLDDAHLDRDHVSRPSRGPSMYQRMQFMDEVEDENDTPLRKASLLLKRQLSKRRSNVPDGALRRSLLGPNDSVESYHDASIPMQDMGGAGGANGQRRGTTETAVSAMANEFESADINDGNAPATTSAFGSGSGENFRTVHISSRESNAKYKYKHNRVSTAKYNILSFLPKFLFEQFSKYANVFFLFTGCIQQISGVSPTSRFTTIVPLGVVLAATAAKELAEDIKRHKSDSDMNKSSARVLVGNTFEERAWRDIQVGDILRVQNKEAIPADIVLLSSSEPEGMCYVETSNLDGETNLKVKQAVPETAGLMTVADLAGLRGHLKTEVPNDSLYTFEGTLVSEGGRLGFCEMPLSPTQVLLRGAILRNTDWIYAVVVFTGHETKLMRNATAAPIKRTNVEKTTNQQIIFLFIILIILAVMSALGSQIMTSRNRDQLSYLYLPAGEGAKTFVKNILTFIILYNNLIPISLIVTMEVVKFQQAQLINADMDMYDETSDTPALARTSSLVEELGQVEYIFSDKTGTLTCNIMEFRQCSIAGVMYSDIVEASKRAHIVDGEVVGQYDFTQLREQMSRNDAYAAQLFEFFQLLSTCHTVIPELRQGESEIEYQASSPDEAALVKGALLADFVFTTRKPRSIIVRVMGVDKEYEVLNINEFNSTRKRMSAVLRCPDGSIKLYCKGADTVIFERLADSTGGFVPATLRHLEEYATEGLRTLCIAMRDISPEEYNQWSAQYTRAATTLTNRQQELDRVAELIERDLELLGATAIEDKLQDGVPQTIYTLAQAGIKIWVLTGDRQETAINIGYSCKLIQEDFSLIICNETTHWETKEFLQRKLDAIREGHGSNIDFEALALIIDGRSLDFALEKDVELLFLELATLCKAVICCRVSPLQKALVVKLVKRRRKAILLAIGDGANDVSMIQAAHVGIGISGQEGLQAARSADFAIAQFRYLRKLLLVHGAWSYHRLSKMILFSFYKNIALYITQFWFALFNVFSGQTIYESWSITFYTVFFTVMPPFAIGVFDQFLNARSLDRYPEMYKMGQKGVFFNVRSFWGWAINAFYHSVILFFLGTIVLFDDMEHDGLVGGQWVYGVIIYTSVLTTVLLKAALITNMWTKWTVLAIPGSLILWFGFLPVYAVVAPKFRTSTEYEGIILHIYANPRFWLTVVLLSTLCMVRDYGYKYLKRMYFTKAYHIVQEIQKFNIPDYRPRMERFKKAVHKVRLLQRLRRTRGYAFSQNEGGQEKIIRAYDTTIQKPSGY